MVLLRSVSLVFLVFLSSSAVLAGQKCYGVNFEGGGTHGSYEAGAMMAITELMPADQVQYDIITGISIGAINACSTIGFPKGQERAMAEHILKFWTSIKNQGQFCKKWRGGDFFSLFFRPSIYDNTNERDVIAGSTGTQVMRNISVAATNVNTGEYKDFSEDIGAPAMARACLASGSAPFIFPSIQIGDQWYMDGGVTSNIDVYRAIERCRGWGFDDEDIVMDVVLCTKPVALSHQRVNNTRQAMDRTTDTMRVHNLMWFLDQTFTNFPEVDFRLVQTPSQHMPPNKPGLPLDFNPVDIQYGINMGYNDGIKLIKEKNFGRKSIQQHLSQSQVHFL